MRFRAMKHKDSASFFCNVNLKSFKKLPRAPSPSPSSPSTQPGTSAKNCLRTASIFKGPKEPPFRDPNDTL